MNLTPREKDKLLVAVAAMVAARRLERGVKLNYPEAVALITDYVLEGARDGRTVAELMRDGASVVSPRPGHGGRPRDDPRDPGRSHLPRRHQARHRARADPVRGVAESPLTVAIAARWAHPSPRQRGEGYFRRRVLSPLAGRGSG